MATFTITTSVNIDELVGKGGGDTYNINAGTLVIDQDSRYGLNATTSAILGPITPSATVGGTVTIRGGKHVQLVDFTGGSGLVPAGGTMITGAAGTGKLIAVYTALNAAPLAVGAAMPATGFAKIKQWNDQAYVVGEALTGITATVAGQRVGWIEVVGEETRLLTLSALNNPVSPVVDGGLDFDEFFEVGTTTGVRSSTYQLPTNGQQQWWAGVWVETAAGSDEWVFWPTTSDPATAAKVDLDGPASTWCWIGVTDGLLRFGADGTNDTGGSVPSAGRRIRIPNVILTSATAAARTVNSLNATPANRYRPVLTSAGRFVVRNAHVGWGVNSFTTPKLVEVTRCAVLHQLALATAGLPVVLTDVGIAAPTQYLVPRLGLSTQLVGAVLTRVTAAVGSWGPLVGSFYGVSFTDLTGLEVNGLRVLATGQRAGSSHYLIVFTRVNDSTLDDVEMVGGVFYWITCARGTVTNLWWQNENAAPNSILNTCHITQLSQCSDIVIDGVTVPPGGGPRTYAFYAYNGCSNVEFRNLMSRANPMSTGVSDVACTWSRVGAVGTLTFATPHGLRVNDVVNLTRCDSASVAGSRTILTVVDANNVTVTVTDSGALSGTGAVRLTHTAALAFIDNSTDVTVQNAHATGLRVNPWLAGSTNANVRIENVTTDWELPVVPVFSAADMDVKSTLTTPVGLTAASSVYGTSITSGFTAPPSLNSTTVDVTWTRSGTVCTVTAPNHGLRTGVVITPAGSSAPATILDGAPKITTVRDADTFTITVVATGATTGTLSYTVDDGVVRVHGSDVSAASAPFVQLVGGAAFTGGGRWVIPAVGDQITWQTPERLIEFDCFGDGITQISGGNATDHDVRYALDRGSGFGTYKPLSVNLTGCSGASGGITIAMASTAELAVGTRLYGQGVGAGCQVTAVNSATSVTVSPPLTGTVTGGLLASHAPAEATFPSAGVKISIRCTTIVANVSSLAFLLMPMRSTETTRDRLYPQAVVTKSFTLTNLKPGSTATIFDAAGNVLASGSNITTGTLSYSYVHSGDDLSGNFAVVWHPDYYTLRFDGLTFTAADSSLYVSQESDLAYVAGASGLATFDWTNKVQTLAPSIVGGVGALTMAQIYSAWKDAVVNHLTVPFAWSVVGGQPTFGAQSISLHYFQEGGWKLRPANVDHTLTLSDGVLIAESGSPFLATVSPHTVMLEWQKPEHVITIDMPETVDSDRLARVEKLLRNKTVTDPDLGTITVYDDDNTTPLLAAELFEDAGGTQAYRGKGADRRDRLV